MIVFGNYDKDRSIEEGVEMKDLPPRGCERCRDCWRWNCDRDKGESSFREHIGRAQKRKQ